MRLKERQHGLKKGRGEVSLWLWVEMPLSPLSANLLPQLALYACAHFAFLGWVGDGRSECLQVPPMSSSDASASPNRASSVLLGRCWSRLPCVLTTDYIEPNTRWARRHSRLFFWRREALVCSFGCRQEFYSLKEEKEVGETGFWILREKKKALGWWRGLGVGDR